MAETNFDSLLSWTFCVREISNGIYRITGIHVSGATIEVTGDDEEVLRARARQDALECEKQLRIL